MQNSPMVLFSAKETLLTFLEFSSEDSKPCKCTLLHSNYMGNAKPKANPIKLCHEKSVVLSSLMTHAFFQFY